MAGNKYNYKLDLLARLQDSHYAELYLDAAAKESQATLLLAIRNVAEAQKGMTQLAFDAEVNRENLYRALSEEGNPRLSTFDSILDALGMTFTIKRKVGPSEPIKPSITIIAGPGGSAAAQYQKMLEKIMSEPIGIKSDETADWFFVSSPDSNGGSITTEHGAGNGQLALVA